MQKGEIHVKRAAGIPFSLFARDALQKDYSGKPALKFALRRVFFAHSMASSSSSSSAKDMENSPVQKG